MVAFLSLLITALNAQLAMSQSYANANLTTFNVASINNFAIGMTFDASLRSGRPSPFTAESISAFVAAWDAKEDDFEHQETFKMSMDIATSQQEVVEALGIEDSLKLSYMFVSGDSHLSFAKQNIQSALDVSVIIKASTMSHKKQLDLSDCDLLELRDITSEDIEEFESLYGAYLLVGYEYGGEIVFQSTHSAQSNEDKLAIAEGLSVAFGSVGFDVAGVAEIAGYKKSDIYEKSVSHSEEYSISPNSWSAEAQSLITPLSLISQGFMDDDPELYTLLAQSAQSLLSSDTAPIKAIIIPLTSVPAVRDAFGETADSADTVDTVPFMTFLNEMYMAVEGLTKQLKLVEDQWQRTSRDTWNWIDDAWLEWDHCLLSLREQMLVINNIADIVEYSNAYLASAGERHLENDVLTTDSFITLTVSRLEAQFEDAIMNAYNAMLESQTESAATQSTGGYVFTIEVPRFTVEVAFALLVCAVAMVGVVSLYSYGMCTKARVYKEVVVDSGCETEEML